MYQYLLLLDTEQEKEFFQKLYREHRNQMYYMALKIVKNESDAEDMVHETFLTLTEHLMGMIENPPKKNWNFILTILKHKCYNLLKKKKKEFEKKKNWKVFWNVPWKSWMNAWRDWRKKNW